MNYPSREDSDGREGWNQSPNTLNGDATTRQDLNGIANSRELRGAGSDETKDTLDVSDDHGYVDGSKPDGLRLRKNSVATAKVAATLTSRSISTGGSVAHHVTHEDAERAGWSGPKKQETLLQKARDVLVTFGKFVGPGFMISVAYIDPGNYSTDVAAGASYQFRLLFIVLMSNLIAIYLQSLCIKLGTVTGMDLAQICRAHLPKWLNYFLYFLAEGAIIATDIAEVIGTAIAINLLIPKIPLVAGCAISIIDVLLILIFYRPSGSMKGLRAFEFFVMALVLGVVICFIIQLTLIHDTSVGEVFRGYLPSSALVEAQGLYQACGILGATVMPHSLYLGSGIVQPRLYDYDVKNGHHVPAASIPSQETLASTSDYTFKDYVPSLPAINFCLKYSIVELALSLFTFALFVNSAILIVAGAALYPQPDDATADLFSIYNLLSASISPAAGTIFALALLLSGISAGIVCTIAGQMVSEGAINWSISPWLRRLLTRSISITPSIIIAGAVGPTGLTAALNGTQVALSVALPFIAAPIIYFTARNKYMTVSTVRSLPPSEDDDEGAAPNGIGGDADTERIELDGTVVPVVAEGVSMRNAWWTTAIGVLVWLVIAAMNVANLVLVGMGDV